MYYLQNIKLILHKLQIFNVVVLFYWFKSRLKQFVKPQLQ